MSDAAKKNEQAVTAILEHPRLQDAAKSLGVTYPTLWRWMQEPELQGMLSEARHHLLTGAITGLQAAMSEAVQTLRDVMGDPETAPSTRVTAARTVLDMAIKGQSVIEVEERLRRIEESLKIT